MTPDSLPKLQAPEGPHPVAARHPSPVRAAHRRGDGCEGHGACRSTGNRPVRHVFSSPLNSIWEAYLGYGPVAYVDSVVGLHHCVASALPHDALASVAAGEDRADVGRRYSTRLRPCGVPGVRFQA
jgi:hypothetical protein